MKYYEFDYKSNMQKALWNLNGFGIGFVYMIFGFAVTVWLSKFLSTATLTIMLIIFCLAGFIISIYNSCKKKGVFLFNDNIEISSVYTKKTIIPINEITDIKKIEKYGVITRGDISFKGGDRTDVVQIHFKNVGTVAFKIKNQNEFLEELHKKIKNSDMSVC